MHDMWWICGSENYLEYNDNKWKNGKFKTYLSNYIYNKKKLIFPKVIISPSKWLIKCTRDSKLYNKSKLINIPYPVDQKVFYPKKNLSSVSKFKLKKTKKKIFWSI